MKKYIRQMIDDLRGKSRRDFAPPIPKPSSGGSVTDLDATPAPVMPSDLENQELSKSPAERVRQLDFQAHEDEVRES